MLSSIAASLHYITLALGLGSVFMRGRYFKALSENPKNEADLKRLFIADSFWGVAAALWLITGLWRAFGGLEKGSQWYLHNPLFHLKMGLFILVFILEVVPMIALIKLRIARKKGRSTELAAEKFRLYRKINHWEAVVVFIIVFVASAMARGLMN